MNTFPRLGFSRTNEWTVESLSFHPFSNNFTPSTSRLISYHQVVYCPSQLFRGLQIDLNDRLLGNKERTRDGTGIFRRSRIRDERKSNRIVQGFNLITPAHQLKPKSFSFSIFQCAPQFIGSYNLSYIPIDQMCWNGRRWTYWRVRNSIFKRRAGGLALHIIQKGGTDLWSKSHDQLWQKSSCSSFPSKLMSVSVISSGVSSVLFRNWNHEYSLELENKSHHNQ